MRCAQNCLDYQQIRTWSGVNGGVVFFWFSERGQGWATHNHMRSQSRLSSRSVFSPFPTSSRIPVSHHGASHRSVAKQVSDSPWAWCESRFSKDPQDHGASLVWGKCVSFAFKTPRCLEIQRDIMAKRVVLDSPAMAPSMLW